MTMISSARVPGRARTLFVLLATGALAAGLAGAVGAATPETLVKACVDKTTKTVRLSVYASPTWCKSTEVYRYWNVTGPQGPQGEQGPAGPPGETSSGASVVAYPWGEFDGDACGTDWATMGAILDEPRSCGSDAPAVEVLTGIEPWGALPLDPADYPAGAVVSVRFAVDINYDLRPGGAEICLRLVDGDSRQPVEESEVCTSDEGWQQTAPVALGAERRTFGIQARQTDSIYNADPGEWIDPVSARSSFLEVRWNVAPPPAEYTIVATSTTGSDFGLTVQGAEYGDTRFCQGACEATAFEGEVTVDLYAEYPFTYLCDGSADPMSSTYSEPDGYTGTCAGTISSDWTISLTPTP